MKKLVLSVTIASIILSNTAMANPISSITKQWTYSHINTGVIGQTSEISAYDVLTNSLWVQV